MSLAAAGCAFYATLALFPVISEPISVGGPVLNSRAAEHEVIALSRLLPSPAVSQISDRVHQWVDQSGGSLSVHLAVGFLLTFWSSSTGAKSVLSAVNVAYGVTEQRPFLGFQVTGLLMTVLCAVVTILVLLLMPPLMPIRRRAAGGGASSCTGWAWRS